MNKICRQCSVNLVKHQVVYCSNKCQKDYEHDAYIKAWKSGEVTGIRGVRAKGISRFLVRYLFEKYNNRCAQCGWNEIHPKTNTVPLEVDHIDGNADNNTEQNLRLLCPNCHSLTDNYRNLNYGYGRFWRKQKYVKIDKNAPL